MENRTLKDWKIYRQFRKTLDTICSDHDDQTWLLSEHSPIKKSFDDILEITSIEDEGEIIQGEGTDNNNTHGNKSLTIPAIKYFYTLIIIGGRGGPTYF